MLCLPDILQIRDFPTALASSIFFYTMRTIVITRTNLECLGIYLCPLQYNIHSLCL